MKSSKILEIAILEMAKRRHPSSICPSEVARWIFPSAWRSFMPDVQESMMCLFRKNKINVTQKGELAEKNFLPNGPVRISINSTTNHDKTTQD